MEKLALLSYNIYFGCKLPAISRWLHSREKTHGVFDILCFQEFPQDRIENFIKKYRRKTQWRFIPSIFLKNKRFGHLTIWNTKKLQFTADTALFLGDSRIEKRIARLFRRSTKRQSLLTLFNTQAGNTLMVANTHLTTIALNGNRISQLEKICAAVSFSPRALIVGDMNYTSAFPRFSLRRLIKKHGFTDATKKLKTHRILFMKHQLDYIFSRGVSIESVETEHVRFSDHYPLIAMFKV